MRRIILAAALALLPLCAHAQGINNPGGACASFGTTAGTCAQGNDARIPSALPVPVAQGGTGITALQNWSIYLNANQTGVAGSAYSLVTFDTKLFDAATICDVVTNKGRCTPTKAGVYRVSSGLVVTGTVNIGFAYCAIYKNGTIYKEVAFDATASAGKGGCTGLVAVNGSTDYIEIYTFISLAAGTATVNAGAADTFFDGEWAGP